ncbi:hypothetical protein [Leptospira jelokensis]|uniref:hypothetical protein n=1 Tax=Leptospira jelokensis TaxID=2484931 RepID=UPI001438555A|nr:hypothetical protein [Leptospira jelokensis]
MNSKIAYQKIKRKIENNEEIKILLIGEWGIGKTYLINQLGKLNLKKILRISLFGVNSTTELHQIIKKKYINFDKTIIKKSYNVGKEIVTGYIREKTGYNISLDIIDLIELKLNFNHILVLEDVERSGSNLSMKEILGFLERYAENSNYILSLDKLKIEESENSEYNILTDYRERMFLDEFFIDSLSMSICNSIINTHSKYLTPDEKKTLVKIFINSGKRNYRILKKIILKIDNFKKNLNEKMNSSLLELVFESFVFIFENKSILSFSDSVKLMNEKLAKQDVLFEISQDTSIMRAILEFHFLENINNDLFLRYQNPKKKNKIEQSIHIINNSFFSNQETLCKEINYILNSNFSELTETTSFGLVLDCYRMIFLTNSTFNLSFDIKMIENKLFQVIKEYVSTQDIYKQYFDKFNIYYKNDLTLNKITNSFHRIQRALIKRKDAKQIQEFNKCFRLQKYEECQSKIKTNKDFFNETKYILAFLKEKQINFALYDLITDYTKNFSELIKKDLTLIPDSKIETDLVVKNRIEKILEILN